MNDNSAYHRQTWELIPWLVNGTASAADRQRVEQHLRECENCRDEYAFQQRVFGGMSGDAGAVADDPQPALQRLFARIDAETAGQHDPAHAAASLRPTLALTRLGLRQRWSRARSRLLPAALIVQACGLLLLGVLLLARQPVAVSGRYQTLSSAPATPNVATIRFVPAPDMTIGALQGLLAATGLHLVESNQGSSIYGLAPVAPGNAGSAATSLALERLRRQPGVLLAEPIVLPATDAQ